MLVLSRKSDQAIQIGQDIVVRILRVKGSQVRLGIEAPKSIPVLRQELDVEGVGGEVTLQSNENKVVLQPT